jgi:ribosomal protein L14
MLNVIDNSGAAVAECINVLKMNRAAKVGTSDHPNPTIPPTIL